MKGYVVWDAFVRIWTRLTTHPWRSAGASVWVVDPVR
jgi:hypothetical protein